MARKILAVLVDRVFLAFGTSLVLAVLEANVKHEDIVMIGNFNLNVTGWDATIRAFVIDLLIRTT